MANKSFTDRLGVCSWSLQPATPQELVQKLEQTGIRRVQLALDPLRDAPQAWARFKELFQQHGITVISGMFGTAGEDYSTLETIRATGGLAPDATWERNWKCAQFTAALAQQLGLKLVTFHAGFLPHDETDPAYAKLLRRVGEVAENFRAAGITLGLETGQETAPALVRFLEKLQRPNVGVNFDPANIILYDKGDPIEALRLLGPWIRQVHIKDAVRTKVPGTWGTEVPAGQGEVDWRAFLQTLEQLNYAGDLVIEREAGSQRVADIRTARELLEQLANR